MVPDIFRTTAPVSNAAYFSRKKWGEEPETSQLARYTLALTLRVPDCMVGDGFLALSTLNLDAYGVTDVRFPAEQKVPGSIFAPVFLRVAKSMPSQTVIEMTAGDALKPDSPLGSFREGSGFADVMMEDSGEDMTPGGICPSMANKGEKSVPVQMRRPYYRDKRDLMFKAWADLAPNSDPAALFSIYFLLWVGPRSNGCDGTQFLQIPAKSNYHKLQVMRFNVPRP